MGSAEKVLTFGLAKPLFDKAKDFMSGPKVPKPPAAETPVSKGEEGIRSGENLKTDKRRALGQVYLTQGQSRQPGLGGTKQTLG